MGIFDKLFNLGKKSAYVKPSSQVGGDFLNAVNLTPNLEEYLISTGRYYNQLAKDPNRVVELKTTLFNPKIDDAIPIINEGMQKAYLYKTSPLYINLVDLLKLGLVGRDLLLYNNELHRPPKVLIDNLDDAGGQYDPKNNTITYDSWVANGLNNDIFKGAAFHEPLHFFRVGSTNLGLLPAFKDVDKRMEQDAVKALEDLNTIRTARDFIRMYLQRKVAPLLNSKAKPYIKDPIETAVHGLTQGLKFGLPPFLTYPGEKYVAPMMDHKINLLGESLTDKRDSKTVSDYWKLLTGSLIPAAVPVAIGTSAVLTKPMYNTDSSIFK